jgi:hypothetical protein
MKNYPPLVTKQDRDNGRQALAACLTACYRLNAMSGGWAGDYYAGGYKGPSDTAYQLIRRMSVADICRALDSLTDGGCIYDCYIGLINDELSYKGRPTIRWCTDQRCTVIDPQQIW